MMIDTKKLEDEEDEAIKLLESYQKIMHKIRKNKRLKTAAYERATACGAANDGVSRGNSPSDKVGNGVAEMERRNEFIDRLNQEAADIEAEILSITSRLEDRFSDVLEMFYINAFDRKKIAEEMHYSTRHVRRLINSAKEAFSLEYHRKKSEMSANVILC